LKVDLVMWAKNGARTLPQVLKRINEVIPGENVANRIVVDDASNDNTVQIAEAYGWKVIANEGSGISDGANTALKHIETDFFASFEQDVLLSWAWWSRIPRLLRTKKVAMASGVRLPSVACLQAINEFAIERCARSPSPEYFRTLDNTIYKTKTIRHLGGFPSLKGSVGVDSALRQRIYECGFEWKVDYTVRSVHLKSFLDELKTQYWYGSNAREVAAMLGKKRVFLKSFVKLLFSPMRGFEITIKNGSVQAMFMYPALRLANFIGVFNCHCKS